MDPSLKQKPRTSKTRWVLWILFATLALVVALMLSRAPATGLIAAPTVADVDTARAVYHRVKEAREQPGAVRISTTWQELSAVVALGGRALGFERAAFVRSGAGAQLVASVHLPLGFWLNGRAFFESQRDGELRVSGRVGRLPVPAFLVHAIIDSARRVLNWRGATLPPMETMVQRFEVNDAGLAGVLNFPGGSKVFSALSGLRSDAVDAVRVEDHYCRLVVQQAATPSADFPELVRRAFAGGNGTVLDNRSIFVALSLLVAQKDVGALGAHRLENFRRCGSSSARFELLGRDDLARHWAVSAALTSAYGAQASLSMGTWKEISDSGAGGSGFSLVDLAADRSGTFSAARGSDEDSATAVQKWLSVAGPEELLPLSALALAEGMTEAEFQTRFASTDSAEFAATVTRIDATLAVSSRF